MLMVTRMDRAIVELTGRDRVRLLHGLSTNDVFLLATGRPGGTFAKGERPDLATTPAGRGHYGTTVSRQGKMIAEYKVRLLEDRIWLETARAAVAPLMAALNASIIMDDVTVTDRSGHFDFYRVDGDRSREALGAPELAPLHFAPVGGMYVSPFAMTALPGYDAWMPAGRPFLEPAGDFESWRIDYGFPRWGVDIDSNLLPVEAGLESLAVSYSKGCYLGQEVIQRVKTYSEPVKRLVRVEFEEAAKLEPPLTSLAISPRTGKPVGLAILGKELASPGTKIGRATVQALRF